MAFSPPNPYLTNIVPLFNVTTSSSGPGNAGNYFSQINGFESMLDYNSFIVTTNSIQSPSGTQITVSSDLLLEGVLFINGTQFGPDLASNISMVGNTFTVSTGTTSLFLQDTTDSNVTQGIVFTTNNTNVLSFDTSGNATFSSNVTCQRLYQLSDER